MLIQPKLGNEEIHRRAQILSSALMPLAQTDLLSKDSYTVALSSVKERAKVKFFAVSKDHSFIVDLRSKDGKWKVIGFAAKPHLDYGGKQVGLNSTRILADASSLLADESWLIKGNFRIRVMAIGDEHVLYRFSVNPHEEWNSCYLKVGADGKLLERWEGY
ncbi:MAG: hypothetical protein IT206_04925 [Fimbriimonadaceae bacterium]|nr:hypothetical protein [Fimbriimonadaceae bacterium]